METEILKKYKQEQKETRLFHLLKCFWTSPENHASKKRPLQFQQIPQNCICILRNDSGCTRADSVSGWVGLTNDVITSICPFSQWTPSWVRRFENVQDFKHVTSLIRDGSAALTVCLWAVHPSVPLITDTDRHTHTHTVYSICLSECCH